MKTLALKRPDVKRPALARPAMARPEGVVDVRKVKSAIGGEGRPQLTWVVAYSQQIQPGTPGHEAIRAFAGTLKAPRHFEQSVMLLPVVAREAPEAEAPPAPPAKPRVKRRAKARPKAAPAKAQRRTKGRVKTAAKARAKPARKMARKTLAKAARRKPARARR